MEPFHVWVNFLLGFVFSGFCVQSSLVFPPAQYGLRAPFRGSPRSWSQSPTHSAQKQQEEQEQVNTVSVICHPDLLEVLIKADLFAVGAPVNSDELRLGVEDNDYCRATASSEDQYRIAVGLADCGTRHWMTQDSLVYTNLLIYAPLASPNGVIRMEEAVIPIECHYGRKYSLSSLPLQPTWIPFMSTQAAVELLEFNLRLMTDDWQFERGANVFYLGERISIEASVRVGHHMRLRVFMSSCVATLHPDMHSEPRYTFIENGCLVDSQLPGSRAAFLPRTQDDELHLVIDAFKFHNDDRGELYITCHLNAVPINDAESSNKACTFINGRWRSADGNDFLCGYCQSQNEVDQTLSKPVGQGTFGPRGFGKPMDSKYLRKSGLKTNWVWEHEARLGPVTVLRSQKSEPLPAELPVDLKKITRPALHGSHWRSGSHKIDEKGLLPGLPSTDMDDNNRKNGTALKGDEMEDEDATLEEKEVPEVNLKSVEIAMDGTSLAPKANTTSESVEETALSNATTT